LEAEQGSTDMTPFWIAFGSIIAIAAVALFDMVYP
jgi:hypothetical protein